MNCAALQCRASERPPEGGPTQNHMMLGSTLVEPPICSGTIQSRGSRARMQARSLAPRGVQDSTSVDGASTSSLIPVITRGRRPEARGRCTPTGGRIVWSGNEASRSASPSGEPRTAGSPEKGSLQPYEPTRGQTSATATEIAGSLASAASNRTSPLRRTAPR